MKVSNQKIFVTGGAGFVGSHFVALLLEKGHQVMVYDNFSVGKRSFLPKSNALTIIKGDLLNPKKLRHSLLNYNPSAVVHLAAIHFIPLCDAEPGKAIATNITGTHNLLNILGQDDLKDLKRVITISSAAVYAPSANPHKETEMPGPVDVYGITKTTNEFQLKALSSKRELTAIAVRLANVYGPNETNPHLIPEIVKQLQIGVRLLRIGNADTYRSYIHARDVATGLLALIESSQMKGYEVVNLGSMREYNAREIIGMFSEIIGERITFTSTKQKKRKNDRKRLQLDLNNIKRKTSWKERYDMLGGLKELLSEDPHL